MALEVSMNTEALQVSINLLPQAYHKMRHDLVPPLLKVLMNHIFVSVLTVCHRPPDFNIGAVDIRRPIPPSLDARILETIETATAFGGSHLSARIPRFDRV